MPNLCKLVFFALALFALPSCTELGDESGNKAVSAPAVQQNNIAPQAQQKLAVVIKPNFSCTGGLKLNASFSHDRHFAYIVLSDSAVRHKLRNTNVASGFEYSNGQIVYREYKGKTTLTDVVDGHTKTVVCHQLSMASSKTNHP